MPPRVTEDEVKAIFKTTISLAPFIATAHLVVEEELVGKGVEYSEERLTEIERYFAAHLACIRDPRLSSQSIGDASESYALAGGSSAGLGSSTYGSQVIMLDRSGRIANLYKNKVGISHVSQWAG